MVFWRWDHHFSFFFYLSFLGSIYSSFLGSIYFFEALVPRICLIMLKQFHGAATLQKIVTKLSKSKFNNSKYWVVRYILGKNGGHVLKNFPGGFAPRLLEAVHVQLNHMVCFCLFHQHLLNIDSCEIRYTYSLSTF